MDTALNKISEAGKEIVNINNKFTFNQNIKIGNPIGNLYRLSHVLVLVKTFDGKYVLGKKIGFYPSHIARFIGGGVDKGENFINAAVRELKEELKVERDISELVHLIEVNTVADTNEGIMKMTTNVYLCRLNEGDEYSANDDVSDLLIINQTEFKELINSMDMLDSEYITDKFSFKWSDWAKIYGPIHRVALEVEMKIG